MGGWEDKNAVSEKHGFRYHSLPKKASRTAAEHSLDSGQSRKSSGSLKFNAQRCSPLTSPEEPPQGSSTHQQRALPRQARCHPPMRSLCVLCEDVQDRAPESTPQSWNRSIPLPPKTSTGEFPAHQAALLAHPRGSSPRNKPWETQDRPFAARSPCQDRTPHREPNTPQCGRSLPPRGPHHLAVLSA